MKQVKYLILGGGIAGTTAAETIRHHDPEGSILIVWDEPETLYSRVMLPDYLRDKFDLEHLHLRKQVDYQQKKIELMSAVSVTSVNGSDRIVTTESGEQIQGEKLLIATGGRVNKLNVPGNDLAGVSYLRTTKDAQQIKEWIQGSKQAVVIGGGFIGIEFAQTFIKHGLETTAVVLEKSFWEAVVGENSGKLLSKILESNGVKVLTESEVAEFVGTDRLSAVKLKNGLELPAQIAGIGIGIHLTTDHLQGSGLKINKGIVTNQFLETNLPEVWAAGDIAEFFDPILNKHHTLGNWNNATASGRSAGLNMVGVREPFETISAYSITVFGNSFTFLGDPVVDQSTQIVERGASDEGKLGRILLRNDIIVGASLINLQHERPPLTNLIKNKFKITSFKEKLGELSFDLNNVLPPI